MTTSSWNRMRIRLALSARVLAHLATKDQFQVSRRDGLTLPDLCHVDFDEPGSKVKSNHCSLQRNDFSLLTIFLLCFRRNESWICLPASRTPCHSPVEVLNSFGNSEQGLADVFELTSFLECLY